MQEIKKKWHLKFGWLTCEHGIKKYPLSLSSVGFVEANQGNNSFRNI